MICEPCRDAGACNSLANQETERDDIAELLRETARSNHEICTDINCTCQHYVGQVLNHERINREENQDDQ